MAAIVILGDGCRLRPARQPCLLLASTSHSRHSMTGLIQSRIAFQRHCIQRILRYHTRYLAHPRVDGIAIFCDTIVLTDSLSSFARTLGCGARSEASVPSVARLSIHTLGCCASPSAPSDVRFPSSLIANNSFLRPPFTPSLSDGVRASHLLFRMVFNRLALSSPLENCLASGH